MTILPASLTATALAVTTSLAFWLRLDLPIWDAIARVM